MRDAEDRGREVLAKLECIRSIIAGQRLSGVLISRLYNVSWLTAGAANRVLYDSQDSLIGILITPERALVIAENGDLDRVAAEEFAHCPFTYERLRWFDGGTAARAAALAPGRLGVDGPAADGEVNVDGALAELRQVLVPGEIARLCTHGREASAIITDVIQAAEPGVRECDLAGELSRRFLVSGFAVSVILIGGDERSLKYRHQVVSDHRIRRHFSFCGVGRKAGLTFPINRVASFGKPPVELEERQRNIQSVYVHLNSLAVEGATLSSIYRELPGVFARAGFEREEWTRHSIGGTMGYHPREQVVGEACSYRLRPGNVVGWNPSAPGVMAEDVYLLTSGGLEYVTDDGRWPHRPTTANGLTQARPEILAL